MRARRAGGSVASQASISGRISIILNRSARSRGRRSSRLASCQACNAWTYPCRSGERCGRCASLNSRPPAMQRPPESSSRPNRHCPFSGHRPHAARPWRTISLVISAPPTARHRPSAMAALPPINGHRKRHAACPNQNPTSWLVQCLRFSVRGHLISYRESEQTVRFHPNPTQLRGEGHPWLSRAQFLVVDLSKQPPRVHWRWGGWDLFTPLGLNRQSRTSSSSWRMTSATPMWAAMVSGTIRRRT